MIQKYQDFGILKKTCPLPFLYLAALWYLHEIPVQERNANYWSNLQNLLSNTWLWKYSINSYIFVFSTTLLSHNVIILFSLFAIIQVFLLGHRLCWINYWTTMSLENVINICTIQTLYNKRVAMPKNICRKAW